MSNRKLSSTTTHSESFGSVVSISSLEYGGIFVSWLGGVEFVLVLFGTEERMGCCSAIGPSSETSIITTSDTDAGDSSAGGAIGAFISCGSGPP